VTSLQGFMFSGDANGHIRQICTRLLIFVSFGVNSLAIFFDKNDANHHESHIVWPHSYTWKGRNKVTVTEKNNFKLHYK